MPGIGFGGLLTALALACLAAGPSAAFAVERDGFRVTLDVPRSSPALQSFRVRAIIEPTGVAANAVLDVVVVDGDTCADSPPVGAASIVSGRNVGGRVIVDEIVDGDLRPGAHRVCLYLLISGAAGPGTLFDSAPVRVTTLRPTRTRPWTIVTDGRFAQRLGPLDMRELNASTLAAALGHPPIKRRLFSFGEGCETVWPRLGLRVSLLDLGGSGTGGCGENANVSDFSIGGRGMYGLVRTSGGLRLGDPAAAIARKHRLARRLNRTTWLLRPYAAVVGTGTASALTAVIRAGRVHLFGAYVGAAGD